MSATTECPISPTSPTASPSRVGGIISLARAELTMLLRNRTAIFNTILIPLLLVVSLYLIAKDSGAEAPTNMLVITSVVLAMAYVVYYNLVTTYVARRESYVLKRMRTGTVADTGILLATAMPSIVLGLMQIVVVVLGALAFGLRPEVENVVAILLAVVLGFTAFAGLAAASTPFTKTAETAQITTMPVLLLSMGLSGMFFPLSVLPNSLESIARLTPGAAVVDLLNIGMNGINRQGEQITGFAAGMGVALVPTLILVAWIAITASVVRTRFPWEPRR